MTRFYMGMLQIQTGRLQEAAQEGLRVLDIGKALGDPRLQCYGAFLRSWALADAADASAVNQAERAVALAPDPTSLAYATGFLGYARLRSGQTQRLVRSCSARLKRSRRSDSVPSKASSGLSVRGRT
jgi:hypothetical protein